MFKDILSISGKSGLYKLVSHGKNMLIVESLTDGKRLPAYSSDKVVTLTDIAMFKLDGEIRLNEVMKQLFAKENGAVCSLDPKSDNETLRNFMSELVPDYDRDRVYPSDIRKLILWYNILIGAGITDFEVEKEGEPDDNSDKKETPAAEIEKKDKPKKTVVKQTAKVQDKKMQTTKQTRTKV
ncbi:MAG: DUF5606 domain-containing protein [Prevotellaceae bacterium]|jgi:hypothetical protein|nr:DUF5606 domain-containing protein [Prevotellaceae bacterium]